MRPTTDSRAATTADESRYSRAAGSNDATVIERIVTTIIVSRRLYP